MDHHRLAIAPSFMKKCRVCGDKALAFNFNGLSCESCKAFFRRNTVLPKKLLCVRGGKCQINKSTRKCCPRCRLDKCLSIGMKKKMIMTTEEKSNKRGNRIKLKENITQSVLHDEIPQPSSSGQEKESQLYDFDTFEQKLFDEVTRASLVFLQMPCSIIKLCDEANPMQAGNLQETYICKIIEFCKSIGAFHCLKPEDQLIVVRGFCSESWAISCAYYYDVKQDGFPNQFFQTNPFIRLGLLFRPDKRENIDAYRNYIYSLHNEIARDKNIRDLLMTMSIFRPKDNMSCPEFIRYQYFLYCRLFLRYLEQKYRDKHKAEEKYCKVMYFMDRMWNTREILYHTTVNVDTCLVSHALANIEHLNPAKTFDKMCETFDKRT